MLHNINPQEYGALGEAMEEAVRACVHCGFCLASCPTYQQDGNEMDSPRGRILLMKQALEHELSNEDVLEHTDQCLGCLACETACPSGVPYRNLISPFRAIVNKQRKRSFMDVMKRKMISTTLPYPSVFRLAARTGKIAKKFSALTPPSFRPMLDLLPDTLPPKQTWKEVNPAVGQKVATVALLTGCAQQVLDPDINTATIQVLNANGIEVIVPKSQGCCGALSWHVGELESAQEFAINNLEAFEPFDAVITNAAGCGSGMHEYDLILKGTALEEQAATLKGKTMDVMAYLATLEKLKQPDGLGKDTTIAYHDACHLAHAQGVRRQPRDILNSIPGVTVAEIANPDICCGSAGTYNIDQPEMAHQLGQQKAQHIIDTGAEMIAMGNIGCLTQIKNHLKLKGAEIPIKHTIQVLRDAYNIE